MPLETTPIVENVSDLLPASLAMTFNTKEPVEIAEQTWGLPEKPDLVLRVGFVGSQYFQGEEAEMINQVLSQLFDGFGSSLDAIVPCNMRITTDGSPMVAKFFSDKKLTLRLVTGLCEGADQVAWQAMKKCGKVIFKKQGVRDERPVRDKEGGVWESGKLPKRGDAS